MKKMYLTLLGLLICMQLAVPFKMIRGQEKILREGKLFRFITQPIDPADPFQGRYVRLDIKNDFVPCEKADGHNLQHGEPIYALLKTDDDGFARFSNWSREQPAEGDFLKTRYRYENRMWQSDSNTWITNGIGIDIQFDRFYMDEAKAPHAEKLVQESPRKTNCWVNVRILDGKAAVEDVVAGGKSLRDLAAKKE
jgi:uncharacterized membrane-anchored protein